MVYSILLSASESRGAVGLVVDADLCRVSHSESLQALQKYAPVGVFTCAPSSCCAWRSPRSDVRSSGVAGVRIPGATLPAMDSEYIRLSDDAADGRPETVRYCARSAGSRWSISLVAAALWESIYAVRGIRRLYVVFGTLNAACDCDTKQDESDYVVLCGVECSVTEGICCTESTDQ